jgi:hypothetical protein
MVNVELTLVSGSRETLDGVEQYLARAGARLATALRLEDAPQKAHGARVVVLFADDYPEDAVRRVVDELSAELIVIVTADVDAWTTAGRPSRVVVLQRPAWGWMLLDAIRTGLSERTGAR